MGYGASGNRGKVPADECEPGVPELAGRITNESRQTHETEPKPFKKAVKINKYKGI